MATTWPNQSTKINWLFLCKSIFLFTIYIIISDYILIIMDIIHLYIDQATLFFNEFFTRGGKINLFVQFFFGFNFDFSIGEHSPWRNNLFRNHKITTKMICFPMCLPARAYNFKPWMLIQWILYFIRFFKR